MSKIHAAAGLLTAVSLLSVSAAQAVEIEYWQYVFDTRIAAVDQLIEKFEADNPGITVKHITFPYADYQTKVIASHAAGQGPDVVQYFYGWLDKFVDGGVLQPLSQDAFPSAEIEADFFPIVGAVKRGDDYYGLPTAVRTLALYYNKTLLDEAGITELPDTLDELVETAKALTKRDGGGNLLSAGLTVGIDAQDHHWFREVLVRQFGGEPYDADGNVAYNSQAGVDAFQWYTDLQLKEKVGEQGFLDSQPAAFIAGLAAFTIDGTFRIGNLKDVEFEWGVTELPANGDGLRSSYSSYFANGIGAGATGEELEASEKFLNYLASAEAQELWLDVVSELPARRSAALTDANLADPLFGPFIRSLDYAHTTHFYDESGQKQVLVDAFNRVVLENQPVADAVAAAAEAEQTLIESYRN